MLTPKDSGIMSLSNELITHIFSFLELSDAARFSATCRKFAEFRLDPKMKVFKIFQLSMAQMQKISSLQTAGYAQFYETKLWRVYTNGNISLDECEEKGVTRVLDIRKPWAWDFSDFDLSGERVLHNTSLAGLHGHVASNQLTLLQVAYLKSEDAHLRLNTPSCVTIAATGDMNNVRIKAGYCIATDKTGSIHYVHSFHDKRCEIFHNGAYAGNFNGGGKPTISIQTLQNDRLLTVSEEGCCEIWDISTPLVPWSQGAIRNLDKSCYSAAVIGSKEQWLIICAQGFHKTSKAEVWDFQQRRHLRDLNHDATIKCFTLINDQFLVLGYSDKTVRIWNIFTGKNIFSYQFDMEILDVRFDGKKLWVAGDTKVAVIG